MAHHLAWFIITGEWPKDQIDHEDRNKRNNRWVNLREATHGQNRANSKTSSSSGYKGVYKTKRGTYNACIRVNKQLINLGNYKSADIAAEVYREAAKFHHGKFARSES